MNLLRHSLTLPPIDLGTSWILYFIHTWNGWEQFLDDLPQCHDDREYLRLLQDDVSRCTSD